ncbi:hypothetical protein [Parvularcula sp. LCG005]|uniref:hypothetical protein n=1 Tax=Parvularcula sp. LCG005 TaxID=3078805 RepID=UPI002943EAF9|nr:hypothetical protein [Parvularcula sp. LCG005]WOI53761.1 hypothetical protein RUI03_01885 [Parvularcula sp. LCG005]
MTSDNFPDALVTTETRDYDEPAVKLLAMSLLQFFPGTPDIILICPEASDALKAWAATQARITLDTTPLEGSFSYNVKPQTFERLFDQGHRKVMWFDSDVIIGPRFGEMVHPHLTTPIVVAEEPAITPYPPCAAMTAGFGWPVGRELHRVINTGIVQLTSDHRELIADWKSILLSDEYRETQFKPWNQRPARMLGDQQVLTALLGAEKYADIPMVYLKEGTEIIQMFGPAGYSPADRLRQTKDGLPPIVHSMGHKPWRDHSLATQSRMRQVYDRLHGELSPYMDVARHVAGKHRPEFPWLDNANAVSSAMRWMTGNNVALAGLPLAVLDSSVRKTKRLLGLDEVKEA